jgi:hypothetical protein
MKLRKRRKIRISRKASKRRRIKIRRAKRPEAKARKRAIRVLRRATDPRVARALGLMRREGASASAAAREERIKLNTLRKHAGRYLYRSGPGKPWKARSEDQLRFSMTVLTSRGPLDVVVPNSRERKLLSQYDFALRMFRAGEDGADTALRAFEGKTVGGHTLITDIKLLIELEEAGQLDFEGFYVAIGSRS